MAETRITQQVKSLANGISKQSPSMRYPNQVEGASNVNFSVIDGAMKRPGTEFLHQIAAGVGGQDYKMHRIERDDDEEYLIIYGPDVFEVLDINNNVRATITKETIADSYTAGITSPDDLRFASVADTTFVLNRNITTKMKSGTGFDESTMPMRLIRTQAYSSSTPLAFELKVTPWTERNMYEQVLVHSDPHTPSTEGNFKLRYKGRETATIAYNAQASHFVDADSGDGVDQRLEALNTIGSGKVICTGGPIDQKQVVIEISRDLDVDEMIVYVPNSLNGTSYVMSQGTDERNPPPTFIKPTEDATEGYKLSAISYFRGRLVLASQDFVIMSAVDEVYNFWLERPSAISDADPIEVQIAGTDVAEVDYIVPFRGTLLINTIQGHQYLLEDVDVLSPTTVAINPATKYETQDVEPVVIGNNMYLGGKSLGSAQVWEYYYDQYSQGNKALDISHHVKNMFPTAMRRIAGSSIERQLVTLPKLAIVFPDVESFRSAQSGDWSDYRTWEKWDSSALAWIAISSGDPGPQRWDDVEIDHTVDFDNYNEVSVADTSETAKAYSYRWYMEGLERVQAAWTEWEFGVVVVLDIAVIDTDLFLLRRVDNAASPATRLVVEKMTLSDNPAAQNANYPRSIRMDQMIQGGPSTQCPASYDAANDKTIWTLYDQDGPTGSQTYWNKTIDIAVLSKDFASDYHGGVLTLSGGTGTTIEAKASDQTAALQNVGGGGDGDYTGAAVMLGRRTTSQIELTQLFFRGEDGNILVDGWTTLDRMYVHHRNSGGYKIKVVPTNANQATMTYTFTTTDAVEFGSLMATVGGRPDKFKIFLETDGVDPVGWSGLEYHGRYSNLSK